MIYRPLSVHLESLVHIYNKTENKCYTHDNMGTRDKPNMWIGAIEE